ncbi:MAG TPA: GNAT family protein [Acidimicrobiales bacterium]|nr:GNAT family protein [Acidimicrobiales bacterium]
MSPARLAGDRVSLRPAEEQDLERIREIMACPGVAPWWWTFDPAECLAEIRSPGPECRPYVIEHDGEVVGLIQYGEELTRGYRHASIDLALHDDHQGRGLGSDALRTMARHLFEEAGHHRITIDPAVVNRRAVRCYESVGFRPVGVMRAYEQGADGTWHDGLLMDLLAEELR